MTELAVLKQQMASISRTLDDPEFLLPRPSDESKAKRLGERLAKLSDDLRDIVSRRIPLLEAEIRSQEQRLKSTSRDARWLAKDRVKQLTADVQEAQSDASKLAKKVRDLLEKNVTPNFMETGQSLRDLVEYAEKAFGKERGAQIQQILSGPVYRPVVKVSSMDIHVIVPLIVLVCVGLKRLSEKFLGGKD